jgi:eukaryotic-like serine/threonine-protein kinase
MSGPPAGQDGGAPASPPRRARWLVLAAVTGLALAVALAAVGLIIADRQPPHRGLIATVSGPGGLATCSAAFSPSSTTLAVASCGGSVSLWDIATRRWIATLANPACPGGGSVVFSPDGKALALSGDRGVSLNGGGYQHPATCLWDEATRRETTLTDPELLAFGSTLDAFSPAGTTLAVADNSGNIYLWNLAARRVTGMVPAAGRCAPVCSVAFSPDGTILAVGQSAPGGGDGDVSLWDLAARRWSGTLTDPGQGPVTSLAFGRNGILAVGVGDDAYMWDVADRRLAGTIAPPINTAQGNASISKDGAPYPAVGAFDHSITAVFSPDGTILAVDASFGYGTYLYDAAARKQIAVLTYPSGQFHFAAGVAFSPDGTMMTVTEARGATYLWNVTAFA